MPRSRETPGAYARRTYFLGKKGRNQPPKDEPWAWMTQELLTSDAWRCLPTNGRKVVERVQIEHMSHAGIENGNLPVTHKNFIDHGVTRNLVTDSIDAASWVLNITFATRNDVDVGMLNGLSRCGAAIHSNIERSCLKLLPYSHRRFPYKLETGFILVLAQVEDAFDVAPWNY